MHVTVLCVCLPIISTACMDVPMQVGIVDDLGNYKYPLRFASYDVKFPDGDRQRYVHSNLRLTTRIASGVTEPEVQPHSTQSHPHSLSSHKPTHVYTFTDTAHTPTHTYTHEKPRPILLEIIYFQVCVYKQLNITFAGQ